MSARTSSLSVTKSRTCVRDVSRRPLSRSASLRRASTCAAWMAMSRARAASGPRFAQIAGIGGLGRTMPRRPKNASSDRHLVPRSCNTAVLKG